MFDHVSAGFVLQKPGSKYPLGNSNKRHIPSRSDVHEYPDIYLESKTKRCHHTQPRLAASHQRLSTSVNENTKTVDVAFHRCGDRGLGATRLRAPRERPRPHGLQLKCAHKYATHPLSKHTHLLGQCTHPLCSEFHLFIIWCTLLPSPNNQPETG